MVSCSRLIDRFRTYLSCLLLSRVLVYTLLACSFLSLASLSVADPWSTSRYLYYGVIIDSSFVNKECDYKNTIHQGSLTVLLHAQKRRFALWSQTNINPIH
ncbi:hypothetical protein DL96DRAFT_1581354 [Flagelloscypha sp. PMI_526]|nr:hypothetical protein DL96DRAFT_1581354 [Flagelloscypha sp. PMI_526]